MLTNNHWLMYMQSQNVSQSSMWGTPTYNVVHLLPVTSHPSATYPHSSPLFLPLSLSTHCYRNGPFHLTLHSTSHAYQLCKLANGRVHGLAVAQYKGRPKTTACIHVSLQRQGQQASRGHRLTTAKSTKWLVLGTDNLSTFRMPWLRFFRDFSPVVRQMPGN
jgi:hypothetical protein